MPLLQLQPVTDHAHTAQLSCCRWWILFYELACIVWAVMLAFGSATAFRFEHTIITFFVMVRVFAALHGAACSNHGACVQGGMGEGLEEEEWGGRAGRGTQEGGNGGGCR